MKKLTALYRTLDDQRFFETMAELFTDVFTLTLLPATGDLPKPNTALSLSQEANCLHLHLPDGQKLALPSHKIADWDSLTSLTLAKKLTQLACQLPLEQLPLHLAITDQDNQVSYHNDRPKDPFLLDDIDQAPVEDWIIQEVQTRPEHAVHLLLPSISFEQILIHSYHGLYQGQDFKGIFQQVTDIKPLLASYLKETGQALVGWSDTTSGASIKNDLFDEEDY